MSWPVSPAQAKHPVSKWALDHSPPCRCPRAHTTDNDACTSRSRVSARVKTLAFRFAHGGIQIRSVVRRGGRELRATSRGVTDLQTIDVLLQRPVAISGRTREHRFPSEDCQFEESVRDALSSQSPGRRGQKWT